MKRSNSNSSNVIARMPHLLLVVVVVLVADPVLVTVESFTATTSTPRTITTTTGSRTTVKTLFLSDVPQDDPETKKGRSKSTKQRRQDDDELLQQQPPPRQQQRLHNKNKPNKKNWKDEWTPEPPEDLLTLSGDIASLFLYAVMEHLTQNVLLTSVWETSTSAADAAHTLDPSGTDIVLASTPVWLDPTALGPHVSDQVLLWDLQSRVTPHLAPLLSSAGMAAVSLATCWIIAGLFHEAFHYRNTLDCPTHRAVFVTGQTWLTASVLLIGVACLTQHWTGAVDTSAASTSILMSQGRSISPLEEWFCVLTKSDANYIVNGLGVVLTWRFLISYLMGGWSRK